MIKLFVDINCPFCFAQHERLVAVGLNEQVEWCYVEHAPELDSASNSSDQLDLLSEEFRLLSLRTKGLNARKPDFCVNSRLAILSLISLNQSQPEKVESYRNALYSAYWRDGRDISDIKVLEAIQFELGLGSIAIDPDAESLQERFQQQWESGGLDERIPAILDESGRALLGLQHLDNIHSFLQGEDISDGVPLVCEGHAKPVVALFNGEKIEQYFNDLNRKYRVVNLNNIDGISSADHGSTLQTSNIGPQIIITVVNNQPLDRIVNQLRSLPGITSFVPVIFVAENLTTELENTAFGLGVADVLSFESFQLGWMARLDGHIRRYQALLHLKSHASIDPLTGLLNRRMLDRQFNEEWRAACRYKKRLAVLVFDIDFFKDYNDFYGHSQGDECLKQVAQTLKLSVSRPKDYIARIGGEEFLVLLPDTDLEGANFVAQRVQSNFKDIKIEHSKSKVSKYLTLSIGVAATFPHADRTPKDLFEFADALLYQSKENGRNQFTSKEMPAPDYSQKAV